MQSLRRFGSDYIQRLLYRVAGAVRRLCQVRYQCSNGILPDIHPALSWAACNQHIIYTCTITSAFNKVERYETMEHLVGVVVGSLSKESINRLLASALIKLSPPGLIFTHIGIGDLPLYDYELDSSPPIAVRLFKAKIQKVQCLLFVTPEYNRSIPGPLKNAIDWGTRPRVENIFSGKPTAMIGASLGSLGTAIAQQSLRSVLCSCNARLMNIPEAYIHYKPDLINAEGDVTVEATKIFLKLFMQRFADFAAEILEYTETRSGFRPDNVD
jgi:chromate reductase